MAQVVHFATLILPLIERKINPTAAARDTALTSLKMQQQSPS